MFTNSFKRISSSLIQQSSLVFTKSLGGRSSQFLTPINARFFANNVRDDKQTTKNAGLENPTQAASKNAGIGTSQGGNWRDAIRGDAVGGVKNPAKEWASETKDKIREPAGNTAPANEGSSNEWAAPGSAKDTLKNSNKAGQKGSLDAEEKHYVGTAGTEIPKGKRAKTDSGNAAEDTHGSVHETDPLGRGSTYIGIKGAKPDYSGNTAQGTPDLSGGTSSQYPGDSSKGNARAAAGTSRSQSNADDQPQSKTGNVQDKNINNLGKGGRQ